MRKLFITICAIEAVPYLDLGMDTVLFGAPLYEHSFRKIKDASNKLGLDVEFVRASNCDIANTKSHINASFEDIVIFASPLAFLARSKDIEGAIDYVVKSDVGYATVGNLRSLYMAVGQGKMLTGCEVGSPSDFVSEMNNSGAKTFPAHFADGEKSVPLTKLDYLKRVEEYRQEFLDYLVMSGVEIDLRDGICVSPVSEIHRGVRLSPNVTIDSMTKIADNASITQFSYIKNSEIGENCVIESSRIIGSCLEHDVYVNAYCNIIDGNHILSNTKIGAYSQLEHTNVGIDTVIGSHVSLDNCNIGTDCIIGNGVISVNFEKSKKDNIIKIADHSVIGNGATLVSPLSIGRGSFVGAGSTITDNIPDGALGIAREYQSNHNGWARRRSKQVK